MINQSDHIENVISTMLKNGPHVILKDRIGPHSFTITTFTLCNVGWLTGHKKTYMGNLTSLEVPDSVPDSVAKCYTERRYHSNASLPTGIRTELNKIYSPMNTGFLLKCAIPTCRLIF